MGPCNGILTTAQLTSFGSGTFCLWTSTSTMLIGVSSESTVAVGDTITFQVRRWLKSFYSVLSSGSFFCVYRYCPSGFPLVFWTVLTLCLSLSLSRMTGTAFSLQSRLISFISFAGQYLPRHARLALCCVPIRNPTTPAAVPSRHRLDRARQLWRRRGRNPIDHYYGSLHSVSARCQCGARRSGSAACGCRSEW